MYLLVVGIGGCFAHNQCLGEVHVDRSHYSATYFFPTIALGFSKSLDDSKSKTTAMFKELRVAGIH